MKINTNAWNKTRYTIHSVYYDLIVLFFRKERKKAIEILAPKLGEKILIVGAGTGLDLPHFNSSHNLTAIDITPAMLSKLEKRAKQLNLNVDARVMDGQQLLFEDNSFDCVLLCLILAVIPDPIRCIKEAERVIKPGGRILVFDKFLGEKQKISIPRKAVNSVSRIFFSEINRKFSDILSATRLKISLQLPSKFRGLFMIYCLTKE